MLDRHFYVYFSNSVKRSKYFEFTYIIFIMPDYGPKILVNKQTLISSKKSQIHEQGQSVLIVYSNVLQHFSGKHMKNIFYIYRK